MFTKRTEMRDFTLKEGKSYLQVQPPLENSINFVSFLPNTFEYHSSCSN